MNQAIKPTSIEQAQNVSSLLVAARKAQGLTSRDIAAALNLSSLIIDDLEASRFDALHGEVFVRSYLKAYAKLVELNEVGVIAQYEAEKSASIEQELDDNNARETTASVFAMLNTRMQHRSKHTGRGLIAAVLVAAAGLMLIPEDARQQNSQRNLEDLPAIVIETAAGTTSIESFEVLQGENPTESLLPKIVSKPASSERANGHSLSLNQPVSSILNFQFSADCWVEVFDGDNQRIYASLKKAQDFLELQGKPPFKVTLGYAPGVSLSYNGQPIQIDAAEGRANLTKLVLGNS